MRRHSSYFEIYGRPKPSVSSKPLAGYFDRSYYTKSGRFVPCYARDIDFGVKPSSLAVDLISLLVVIVLLGMFGYVFLQDAVMFGSRIDGNSKNILINDEANILSEQEEQELLGVFEEVYAISGMPVCLVTTDTIWNRWYASLDDCAAHHYSLNVRGNDALLILISLSETKGEAGWVATLKRNAERVKTCFGPSAYRKFAAALDEGLGSGSLTYAITYAFEEVKSDFNKPQLLNLNALVAVAVTLVVGVTFPAYSLIVVIKKRQAYNYFKEYPNELENSPIAVNDFSRRIHIDPQ